MDNTQNLHKTRSLVRFIGALFALMGGVNFVLVAVNGSAASALDLICTLPVYFLMLMGGALLFAFRPDGLELIFIILRLYVVLGLGTVASSVLVKQPGTAIVGCTILFLAMGLMIFLSRNNVKSLFSKKE